MNRLEELKQLKNQKTDLPDSLDQIINQQVHHYYQYQKRKKYIYYPIISLCTIVFTCLLTFNLFPHIAYACKDIPMLENVAKTLCFNQTVRDCIDNDYAIYVHQTDKDMTLEYIIVDETQITFYLKNCQLNDLKNISFLKQADDYSTVVIDNDSYVKIQCMYNDINQVEFQENLTFTVNQQHYQFSFKIDKNKIKKTKVMTINQTIMIHNQKLTVQKIEVSPTVTKVYIQADPNNTLLLEKAHISIQKDQQLYTNDTGLYAQQIKDNVTVFMIESPYFKDDYTLSFHRFFFVSPQYDHCPIDIENKTVTHLPNQMQIDDFDITDNKIKITLSTENPYSSYAFVEKYRDNQQEVDLKEAEFGSYEKNGKMINYQMIEIPYQKGHHYELDIDYQDVYSLYDSVDIHQEDFK